MDWLRVAADRGALGVGRRTILTTVAPTMAGYTNYIKEALWHCKECVKSLRRAADAIGCDLDAGPLIAPRPNNEDQANKLMLRLFRGSRH